MKEILKLDHIQKYYGNGGNVTKAIQDISFSVQEGEFVGIMGASGSGKTTLLNCISTIDTVSAGHIYLDGTDVTEINEKQIARFRRENLGFVFQDFNLLDTFSLKDNIFLPLVLSGTSHKEMERRLLPLADELGIKNLLEKYPYEVSGGQKQRVAVARAVITQPQLLLADEPTGALDYETGKSVLKLLQDTCRDTQMTVLLITHNQAITPMADRVITMKNGKIAAMQQNAEPVPVSEIAW